MLVGVFIKNSAYFCGGYKEEQDTLPVMRRDRQKQGITMNWNIVW